MFALAAPFTDFSPVCREFFPYVSAIFVVLNSMTDECIAQAETDKATDTPERKPLHGDPSRERVYYTSQAVSPTSVPHIRIHDLRHSYASLAVNAGASLYAVQHLLGHASPQVTQRYAHMADAGLRDASQAVADVVSKALQAAEAETELEENGEEVEVEEASE